MPIHARQERKINSSQAHAKEDSGSPKAYTKRPFRGRNVCTLPHTTKVGQGD